MVMYMFFLHSHLRHYQLQQSPRQMRRMDSYYFHLLRHHLNLSLHFRRQYLVEHRIHHHLKQNYRRCHLLQD